MARSTAGAVVALLLLLSLAACTNPPPEAGLPVQAQAIDTTTPAATEDPATPTSGPVEIAASTPTAPANTPASAQPAATAESPAAPPEDRSILAKQRVVTYYGFPDVAVMGILGEYSPEELVGHLKEQAAAYEQPDRPVQPAIHLIASVAQASPGADGLYLYRAPAETIEKYVKVAEDHGLLLILDLQIGRGTVADDLAAVLPYLARPNVHLALDPEFTMQPNQVPGINLGGMDASDINQTIQKLAEIARQHDLPNKILIVHQFDPDMIRDKSAIRDDPRVDLVIDMDGWGGPHVKIEQYRRYIREERIDFGGIKLFYRWDKPLMSPEDVLALDPPPDVVIYQ